MQGTLDPVEGLKSYAVISASLFVCVSSFATILMIILDRRLIPRLTRITKAAMRELLHVGGWNAVAVTSLGMHIRIDAILMNLFLGLGGNLIYGFTSQLTSYVRMLGMGVSYGLDAVTTRINIHGGDNAVQTLCHHITRLNSCIAFPAERLLFKLIHQTHNTNSMTCNKSTSQHAHIARLLRDTHELYLDAGMQMRT